jgi:site-specific DNA recombinase
MKAVAYLRVSTEDQAARGVSLEAQRAKIAAYAGLYDLELVAVVEDAGLSARTLDRPGLQRALTMLARGEAQALIVLKLDRLTRSVRDLGELLEGPFARAALLSVGEQIDTRTAAGRLVLNVLASVAQWERETIGERTATAMAHKKTKGERVGAVPYGYGLGADGHALVPVAAEQAVIAEARRLKASGLALRAIAAELERAGMVARNGRRFEAAQVQRMVAA